MAKDLSNSLNDNNLNFNNKKLLLLQQELDVNMQQQSLVNQRLNLIKESMNELPDTDPDYSILFTQLEMDQIELDELKKRQEELTGLIKSY